MCRAPAQRLLDGAPLDAMVQVPGSTRSTATPRQSIS